MKTNFGFEKICDFNKELEIIYRLRNDKQPMPEKFLTDLKTMPDSAGIALGLDRLVMLFTGSLSIDDVLTFTPEEL